MKMFKAYATKEKAQKSAIEIKKQIDGNVYLLESTVFVDFDKNSIKDFQEQDSFTEVKDIFS